MPIEETEEAGFAPQQFAEDASLADRIELAAVPEDPLSNYESGAFRYPANETLRANYGLL